jgi:hypothetical protein
LTVFRPLFLLFLIAVTSPLHSAPDAWPVWVGLEVPTEREASAVALLEGRGITVVAWENAVVEVSDFDGAALRPVSSLESTLTPWDPRWDPWLVGMKPVFRPSDSRSRLWVEASRWDEARRLVTGGTEVRSGPGAGAFGARRVTGWLIFALAVLYLVLRLIALLGARQLTRLRSWQWAPLTAALLAGGLLMTGGGAPPTPAPVAPASWLRHLWYQQAWPYGAAWGDWKPGTAWLYPAFEHRDGRIVEVKTPLAAPDKAWAEAAYSALDEHDPARLFPRENP